MNNKLYVITCDHCNLPILKFRGYVKEYGKFCSVTCLSRGTRTKVKETKKKRYGDENYNNPEKNKETCIERYGVDNGSKTEETKRKIKQTKKENHGDENYVNVEKRIRTNIEKYGVRWAVQDPGVRQRIKNTNLKLYGVEYPFQSKDIHKKIQSTNIINMGHEYPFQNPEVQDKVVEFYQDNFGVRHNMHVPEIAEKCLGWHKNSWHEYTLPSGKVIKLQGFEPKALDILLTEYSEDEILYKRSDMPRLFYTDTEGKERRYYPDFYIPKENLLIEVKSSYTYEASLEKNLLKEQCAIEHGFDYR